MTDIQRKQIQEMRIQGMGYRAIANAVGLTRDIVRNYCKSNNLEGYAKELTLNIKEKIHNGEACPYCGKEIYQPIVGRHKKFCSDTCRRQWWNEHPELIQKKDTAIYIANCIYCGKEFKVYGNKNRKYCNRECYIHDRFWREEEGREPYKIQEANI